MFRSLHIAALVHVLRWSIYCIACSFHSHSIPRAWHFSMYVASSMKPKPMPLFIMDDRIDWLCFLAFLEPFCMGYLARNSTTVLQKGLCFCQSAVEHSAVQYRTKHFGHLDIFTLGRHNIIYYISGKFHNTFENVHTSYILCCLTITHNIIIEQEHMYS